MKLANVPTCPFPTYRVFLAACYRAAGKNETEKILLGGERWLEKRLRNEAYETKVFSGRRGNSGTKEGDRERERERERENATLAKVPF